MIFNPRFFISTQFSVKFLLPKSFSVIKFLCCSSPSEKEPSHQQISNLFKTLFIETFVEQNRFKGTCYKAANWILTGQTKGTAKRGHNHLFHGKIKDVYLYPLRKNFRKRLTG
ncbi:MAG: DUF4338 domain-containing protein [Thermodesulfobacteriota bacterium]|nr:DUF4338 domain-containing protein [Thermodesulfobacteriota bacterium]